MDRQKITLEYPLQARSTKIIWAMIATAAGLRKWFADDVRPIGEDSLLFTWGNKWGPHDTRTARVIRRREPVSIRFRWDGDSDDNYWELRLQRSDITEFYHLIVTDFTEDNDTESLEMLWDKNMDMLHRCSGI